MEELLTLEEKNILLRMAREAIECGVRGKDLPPLDESTLPPRLCEEGASFVTLTIDGELRGCIGALEPYRSLAEDVREHTVAAAIEDPRFPVVRERELDRIRIEVSRLTRPVKLEYNDTSELLSRLRPKVDGVILRDASRRSTFLPQVWEKIPDPVEFLNNLCFKMGADPFLWQRKHLDVFVYQVEEFHEPSNTQT